MPVKVSDSCGLIELCCDMMVGPSYCVCNNGFVMFPPLDMVSTIVSSTVVSDYQVLEWYVLLCCFVNCCVNTYVT